MSETNPTKPESHCPPTADDSSAHADHGTDAFEITCAEERERREEYGESIGFSEVAQWARQWTLANDPTVRALVEDRDRLKAENSQLHLDLHATSLAWTKTQEECADYKASWLNERNNRQIAEAHSAEDEKRLVALRAELAAWKEKCK